MYVRSHPVRMESWLTVVVGTLWMSSRPECKLRSGERSADNGIDRLADSYSPVRRQERVHTTVWSIVSERSSEMKGKFYARDGRSASDYSAVSRACIVASRLPS